MFLGFKFWRKRTNITLGLCQQTRKVQSMHLAFKNLKVSTKIGQQLIPKLKAKHANDVFRGENATRLLGLIQLQLELEKTVELTYLKLNKQKTTYCLRYLEVWKLEEKVSLVYLECKLIKDKYGSCIFNLKFRKTVEKSSLYTSKQQTKEWRRISMLKRLRKGNVAFFDPVNKQARYSLCI